MKLIGESRKAECRKFKQDNFAAVMHILTIWIPNGTYEVLRDVTTDTYSVAL